MLKIRYNFYYMRHGFFSSGQFKTHHFVVFCENKHILHDFEAPTWSITCPTEFAQSRDSLPIISKYEYLFSEFLH